MKVDYWSPLVEGACRWAGGRKETVAELFSFSRSSVLVDPCRWMSSEGKGALNEG